MARLKDQAASVGWKEIEAAIQANPHRNASLQGAGAASASITNMPSDTEHLGWLPEWTEDTTCTISDAVSLALWVREPLYRVATGAIRRSMEMEEAAFLLNNSEIAWKQHNGRVRGWVRKHLEEDLRLRAGGGDPTPDAWDTIRTIKRAALLLDYVCIMRGLRVALWWPDQKAVTVVPLTGVMPTVQIIQINCLSGRILMDAEGHWGITAQIWPTMLLKAAADIVWGPPACAPSIGSQTVAQIQERIQTMSDGVSIQKTGGRTAMWNRLMWLTLKASLDGKETMVEPST